MVNHPEQFTENLNPWVDLKEWAGKKWAGNWFNNNDKPEKEEKDVNTTCSIKDRYGDCRK